MKELSFAHLSYFLYLSIQKNEDLINTGKQIITSVKQLLSETGKQITIVPHENPDGDAIGSALGLAEVLKNAGHLVNIISPTNYPDFLKWFSAEINISIYENNKNKCRRIIHESDLLICVDFNDVSRSGHVTNTILEFSKPKILIDHHPYPTQFCDFTISEPSYSSTAELIFDLIKKIDFTSYINKNAAEALYTGILTDTGGFSHNTARPNLFLAVSELMKHGIDTDKIQSNIYHNFSAHRMKLLGYSLNEKMEVFPEYRAAVISLSKKELEQFNFKPGDTEGFVNYPLSIKNIVFSALFIEKENFVKASFRSKGDFPSNLFSKENFNGGGHLNAAGGESFDSFIDTVEKFRQLLPQYKHLLLKTKI